MMGRRGATWRGSVAQRKAVKTADETLAVPRRRPPEEIDAARARVDVVSAQIASLEKGLSDATLKCP
jgi:hypothetical protein